MGIALNLRSRVLNTSHTELHHLPAETPERSTRQRTITALLLLWCVSIIFLWLSYVSSSIHLLRLFGKSPRIMESFSAAGRAFIHNGPSRSTTSPRSTISKRLFRGFTASTAVLSRSARSLSASLLPHRRAVRVALTVVSFVVSTFVLLLISAYVLIRLFYRFSNPSPVLTLALLLFFPIPFSLFYGQATILLLFAVLQAYEASNEEMRRAGMSLAVLFL